MSSLVRVVHAAASGIYESMIFTFEAREGLRSYLEWEAQAFGGMRLDGFTVLTKNDDGKIVDVAIRNRPLGAALRLSLTLKDRLRGVIDSNFLRGN